MDGRHKQHLVFVVFAIVAVVDVSAQGSCTVTPLSPTTLSATGGALPNGTMNVMIQCNCTNDDGTVVGKVRWYDPAGTRLSASDRTKDPSAPRFTKDGSDAHVILVIPTFNDSYDGIYTCANRADESDDGLPGSPSVTVTLTVEDSTTRPTSGTTEAATTASTEPTTASTEPTTASTEPTTASTEPTTASTEPTTASTEPTTASTEPTTASTEPTTASTEPTTASTEPTTASTEPTTTDAVPQCTITPLNPTTLTATGGALVNGTTDVRIQCVCPITGNQRVRWFDINTNFVFTSSGRNYVAGSPYHIRNNPTDGENNVTLVIPTFNDIYDGTYYCGIRFNNTYFTSPSAAVTLTIACTSLTAPSNGKITCSLGVDGVPSTGDTCTYTCNTGYVLTGSPTSTCQSDGNWSSSAPTCTLVATTPPVTSPEPTTTIITTPETTTAAITTPEATTIMDSSGDDIITISLSGPTQGMVGSPEVINCTVSTFNEVNTSSVIIRWMGPGGNINATNVRVSIGSVTDDGNNMYTSSLQFDYLIKGDEGNYTCNVTIDDTNESQSLELQSLTIPAPTVTISPSGSLQGAIAGSPQNIQCTVGTVIGVESSSVMVSWMGPGGSIIRNDSRVTISQTTSSGNNMYTSSLQFTYLMEGDEGTYTCIVMILDGSRVQQSIIVQPLTVPNPTVSVTGLDTQEVGSSLMLQCEVTAVRGITSRVDIVWSSGGMELERMNGVSSTTMDNSLVYTHSYTISQLSTTDDGRVIQCKVVINADTPVMVIESITLDVTVPTPTVSVTAPSTQIVGDPLTLQCKVTTVRGITNRVDIVWSSGDMELEMMNNVSSTTMGASLVYIHNYTISQLSTTDEGRAIQCKVVINTSPSVMATGSITLDVTAIISPSNPIQEAMVGSPQVINCTVSTVSGVKSSSVMISWMGPGGDSITSDSRVTISPTTFSGNNYTSSLQFTYLMERDEGTYTCNVMILKTSLSHSVELQLIIPTPTVSITTPSVQTVGQALTLECIGTTVRGVTTRVDIMWERGGTEVKSTNRVTADNNTMNNSLVYRDSYTISQLNTSDDGIMYKCILDIRTKLRIITDATVTLDVTVPNPTVTISPSGPIQGAMVGSPQVINCTVSTVSGVESSLVMISWMGPQGNINATNGRVFIGSLTGDGNNMYTRSLQFTYLMEGDEDTYICNVMILETNESSSIEIQPLNISIPTVSISVTAPNMPKVSQSLMLQCEVTTMRGVSSKVDIVWSSNGTVLRRMNNATPTTVGNSQEYSDTYSISLLRTSDKGRVIQCEGIIQVIPSLSNTNTLTLMDFTVPKPSVSVSQLEDSPNIGQTHNLTCTVTVANGTSPSLVMVNWSGGDSLSESSRVTISDQTNNGLQYTRIITFSPIFSGDKGQYTCSVSVTGFSEANNSDSVMVVVSGLPVVTVMPSSQSVEVTHNAAFNATVTGVGSNNFTYQWRHNETIIIINETTNILIISNVSTNNTGEYSCTVMNQYGDSNSSSASLIVTVTPPVITIHPMNTSIQLYSNFTNHTLNCEADGALSYNWERQNDVIPSDSTGVNTNTLTLINLQPEDAGNYRCVATNASGSSFSNYANLAINVPPPRIIEHPMPEKVPVTKNVEFTCVGEGYGVVDVSWTRNGGSLRRNSIVTTMITPDNITTITSILTISNLKDNNGGNYRCIYSNSAGEMRSDAARLTIGIDAPEITSHPMNMRVNNGSNVTFKCVSFSYGTVTYTWLKNGTLLDDDVNVIISTDSDEDNNNYTTTLMILDVQLSDNGVYVCNATNREGSRLSNIATLSVIVPPTITLHPDPVVTNKMGGAELSCNATSIVNITFHWEKFNNDDGTWGSLPSSTSLTGMNTMTISSINIQQSDEGNYRCTASNSAGTSISDIATITVYGPPVIVSLSDSTTVVEGESVSFVCEATNDPDAIEDVTIRWYNNKDHRLLNANDRIAINNTMETGPNRTVISTLTIDPVIHQDAGEYRCTALNHPILMVSNTTQLTVRFAPIVTIVITNERNQSEVNATFNEVFTINCSVESYPPAMVYWEENGEEVNSSTVATTDSIVRQLVTVDTSTLGVNITYTCVAVNVINEVNHSANNSIDVFIQDIPDIIPPNDITQHERTVTSVVVQWKEPNYYNAPITMYSLNLCQKLPENDDCTSVDGYPVNINADQNTIVRYNISGLQPFSSSPYLLSISAINDIGSANFSSPIPLILVNRMEAAAQNLTLIPFRKSEVNATWDVNPDLFELDKFIVAYFIKPEQQEIFNVTTTFFHIIDLIPGETYTVRVTAQYNETNGSSVFPADPTERTIKLDEIEPAPPMVNELMLPVNDNDSLILSWAPPNLTEDNRRFFQGFDVSISRTVLNTTLSQRRKRNTLTSESQTVRLDPSETSYAYNNRCRYHDTTLCPYSRYCLSVVSVFEFGGTPIDKSDPTRTTKCTTTDEAAPNGPPEDFNVTDIRIHEIEISWKFPQLPNGMITGFTVYYNDSELPVPTSNCDNSARSCLTTINDLDPFTPYIIEVSCSTGAGEGPLTNVTKVNTTIGSPRTIDKLQPVSSQAISTEAITSLEVDIQEFSENDGPISHYFIVVINVTSNNGPSASSIDNSALGPHGSTPDYYVAAVKPRNKYNASVPYTLGNGENTTFEGITYKNVPITLGEYRYFVRAYTIGPRLSGDSDESNKFEISRASEDDDDASSAAPIIGAIAAVAVILLIVLIILIILAVITRRRGQRTSAAKLDDAESIEMRKQGSPASPAARNTAPVINTSTVEVITSVNQPTTLFIETTGNPPAEIEWSKDGCPVNHPIMSDGSLYIMHTEPSDQGEYTVTATNPVGSSRQVITVTVIQPVTLHSDPDHKLVKKDDFAQHMALLRSDMEEGFKMEYESLDMAEWEFTQYNAKVTVNKNKNRYINIIPYDHSRVVLSIQDNNAGSDYINASTVNGYNEKYIATQGPIPSSYGDFWRMIWENESSTIIMLTNLKEDDRVKCHQYWPSYGSAMYGNFQVTLRDVENLAEYSVRIFSVQPIAGSADYKDDLREVRQFHFTVWPDHGVPKYGTALLSFQKRIDKFHDRKNHGPMVVHCSAGVGRTGTFITIDTQLQRIIHEGTLDIFNFVRHLRYCRNYMVQTQAQYVFLHDAILEALMCGDTSIAAPVKDAKEKVAELAKVDPKTGKTGFETQFENLTKSSPAEDTFECNVARLPDNMRKNRFPNYLPSDVDRVVLSTDNDQPDYINACFLDGYRHRNAFIGTQGPMRETVGDFWRMIWEHKSYAVIMLTELQENGKEMCCQYWPDPGVTLTYDTCIVENISEDHPRQEYIKRSFRIALTSSPSDTRVITQFHFQQWPVNACPNNPASIIDLLEAMERVQRKTGNGPVTVHCNDGIGRTGTFCALAASLERFKTEQMVDVFHTIKTIRIQRVGMVQTLVSF